MAATLAMDFAGYSERPGSQESQKNMIQIITTMVKTELAFLQMKGEFIVAKAVEFLHATLGKRPKALNAVDVIRANGGGLCVR